MPQIILTTPRLSLFAGLKVNHRLVKHKNRLSRGETQLRRWEKQKDVEPIVMDIVGNLLVVAYAANIYNTKSGILPVREAF